MLPKIIHTGWINENGDGGEKDMPEFAKNNIRKWRDILPDYEIKIFDNKFIDYCKDDFSKMMMKYGLKNFICEKLKMKSLMLNGGGIWLDPDVNLYRRIDDLLDCQGFVQNCFNSVFEEKDIDLNDDRQLMNPAMIFTNNCMFGFTDDNPILFELEKKYDKIKFLLCIEDVYKITPIVLWSKVFYKFFIKNNIAIDTTLQEYLSTKILKTKHMNFHANCTIYHEGCQNTDLKKYRIDKANPYAQHMPTSGTKYMYEILGAEAVKDYHSYMWAIVYKNNISEMLTYRREYAEFFKI